MLRYLPDAPLTFHETGGRSIITDKPKPLLSVAISPPSHFCVEPPPYAPTDENYVLFVEEAEEDDYVGFDRI